MSELKPCPFCGSDKLSSAINGCFEPSIACDNCGAYGPNDISKEDAVRIWNHRRPEDALRARIAELEAATGPIPATEQLPDDNVRVIVFDTTLERVGIARHVAQVPQWATDDGVFYHNDSYGWITHWQPLPQPPEVQE